MIFEKLSSQASFAQNLKLIAISRVAIWAFAQCFLLVDHVYLNLDFNFFLAQGALSLLALSALFSFFYLNQKREATERNVKLQLISDALIMTLIFHITGGAANPFVSLLLFPLMISASILSARFSWFMVVLTLTSFGSLYIPELSQSTASAHEHHAHAMHGDQPSAFSLHIIGMWFNFALSAILISIFIVRMRSELDKQRTSLNQQREQALRDEQLLGIATQAASAAHHMSTPLSTMSILVEDMLAESNDELLTEDLAILKAQLNNCKGVLNKLRDQAQQDKQYEPIKSFVDQLVDEFRLLRPNTPLHYDLSIEEGDNSSEGLSPKLPQIESDPALRMALLNVLNNAADASPEKVHLTAKGDNDHLTIEITDYGSQANTFKDKLMQSANGPVSSNKSEGMGIGLFLSHATINRHQGEISLLDKGRDGNCITIILPLI